MASSLSRSAVLQVDEQRQAEENENGGKPAATVAVRVDRAYSFTQVTSDQILGMFTFSIEIGSRSAWARNAGRSRSDLNPMCTVNGEMARSSRRRGDSGSGNG